MILQPHRRRPRNDGLPRLLMVTPRFAPEMGGVERHVEEVATRAAQQGCDVTVLCTDRSGRLARLERRDGFTVRRVRAWPRGRDYHVAPGLYREITAGPWSLVHVQSYHTFVAPLAMLAARRAGIPYLVTFHGGGHSSARRDSMRGIQRRVLAPLLRGSAGLVAVAAFEVSDYGAELGLGEDHFHLIPNGVDPIPPPAASDGPGPAPGTLIASVGRLERYKGHHRAIDALPDVLRARPDARLWIAGSGPYESELRDQAARLGVAERVEIEAVADRQLMAARMQRCDLVVLLSDFETHPLTVLEAVSLGRPVLVADNSGMREMAEQGLARAIPTESSPAEVAGAILRELDSPEPVPQVQLPSWDDCAAALLDLYGTVIGRDPRPPSGAGALTPAERGRRA